MKRDNEKLPYPKSVLFILTHQVFERFSFWGIVVVLPLFLRNVLGFDDDTATSIYHGFTIFGYLSAFIGAIMADSFFGKFFTVAVFSIVYLFGTILLTLSATPFLDNQWILLSAILGLILTGLASGSIKPCIIAFGADQFTLPQQQKQLDTFFPILYIIINFSLFFTAIITPVLRKDVSCFDQKDTCYSLAFFVPFVCVLISSVIFLVGKSQYKNNPVDENVVYKACLICWASLRRKLKIRKNEDKKGLKVVIKNTSDEQFEDNLKSVMNIFILFLPVSVFWSLYDQQFSRWTFQASRMNGMVFGYSIKPDQFATLNFMLTFFFIPFFDKIIYPNLSKINLLTKPLTRVIWGSIFASIAFIICGFVELKLEGSITPMLSSSVSQLNIINGGNTFIQVTLVDSEKEFAIIEVPPFMNYVSKNLPTTSIAFKVEERNNLTQLLPLIGSITLTGGHAFTLLIYNKDGEFQVTESKDDLEKSLENNAKLKIICGDIWENQPFLINLRKNGINGKVETVFENCNKSATNTVEASPGKYVLDIQSTERNVELISINLETGGSYIMSLSRNLTFQKFEIEKDSLIANIYTLTEPNAVSMLWLLPQYIVMSIAEVLLEVSLTGFAYDQAPKNLKSLLQVVNLIPPAFGGMLVIIFAKVKFFKQQSMEFFLFAAVNFIAVGVLVILTRRYKPIDSKKHSKTESESTTSTVVL